MPSAPRISAVVVTHDRPQLLAHALGSIAAQTRPPDEVIVADEGSEPVPHAPPPMDGTAWHWLRARAGHAGAARNRAVEQASGEWITFLDDDDVWRPGHLDGFAATFADPDAALSWRDCVVVRERLAADGTREVLDSTVLARDWDEAAIRRDYYMATSAWGVRRTLFLDLGGFDESFRYTEDWEFVLRASARTRPRRVPGVTVEVRMRDDGHISTRRDPERQRCLERLAERHGMPVPEIKTFVDVAREFGG